MRLFVGLGNIGDKYHNTPHNAGFLFVDMLREYLGWDSVFQAEEWVVDKYLESQICRVRSGSEVKILLLKPTTFMNASGRAVKKAIDKWEVDIQNDFFLAHDDLDLKLGTYKIQKGKGPKIHKGINSVVNLLGRVDFMRIRLGVDNRNREYKIPGEDYVLKKYSEEELNILKEEISSSVKDLRGMVSF